MKVKQYKRDLALIGAGYWGKNLARVFSQLGALHTVCDASNENLKRIAVDCIGVNCVTSSAELLCNDEITRVAIAAPAAYHYALTKEALLAGKDVLVEKPLCLEIDEAAELVELAEERGCILMVGHLLQYHPCVEKLQGILSQGKLGKLHYISLKSMFF